ncbi:hypothetical protein [Desulfotomaculum copahuensis]|uniref:Uncharacterized protein n=1 Tax=Desulfotomaculum copahuensis TaxID=1838280 RepID=A0A1B7LCM1_9FIRM|nr:hypothetical protein [Desulfotomaculum copahuensis]OAT80666.1 hypothetical protein A6M21_13095 [Desulfotomaculum copahuensis]
MILIDLTASCRTVSVIGMAKNTGKTATLNHLVAAAARAGLTVGLTSIGRDGEQLDALYNMPKPPVYLPAGALMATAAGALDRARRPVDVLERTGFCTPLGEVVIARAKAGGPVELAGPHQTAELAAVCRRMLSMGARPAIIDGAFDRVAGAAPALAGGVILATGAALDRRMETVVERTRVRVEQLRLPPVDGGLREAACRAVSAGAVAVIDKAGVRPLPVRTALAIGDQLAGALGSDTLAVAAAGAVGGGLLEILYAALRRGLYMQLIIKNATCLFVEPELWRRFRAAGGEVRVLEPVRLLAVTVNPVSPTGYRFDARGFRHAVAEVVRPVPVFDVVGGESMCFR